MGIQALHLFLHRVDTEAGPRLNSTQRRPSQWRALPPAPREQGQPGAPRARPGSAQPASPQNQPAGQAGSRGAGGPCLHLLSQSTGRGRPTWPLLGHRRGVGTQVALPWTQVLGGPRGPTLGGSWTALPWTQVGGGNPGGPALDTGVGGLTDCPALDTGWGWELRWPCLGHRCWGTAHGQPCLGSQNTDALAGNHTAVS